MEPFCGRLHSVRSACEVNSALCKGQLFRFMSNWRTNGRLPVTTTLQPFLLISSLLNTFLPKMTIGQLDQKLQCEGDHDDTEHEHVKGDLGNGDCLNTFDEGAKEVDIFVQTKQLFIQKYLEGNDKIALKAAATSPGGLLDNHLRLQVWSKLANIDDKPLPTLSEEDTQKNNFYRQVILDVDRSLKRFPPSVHEHKRILYQDSLTKMIIRVLSHNPSLHYYQGYHDICLTFLLMMDEESAFRLVNTVSNTHLCYYMEESMQRTSHQLEIIYLLLNREDGQLHEHLVRSEVGTIFSLSWVITWFSHVLSNFDDITRLFDYFISSHFLMPIYLTVSILIYKKDAILNIDCDMASMHQYLTGIPHNERLPFDQLVDDSLRLSVKYPPEDTLDTQKELHERALKGELYPKSSFRENTANFLSQNVFSITFVALMGAMIYQLFTDYSLLDY